jgi:dTDP-4-dehydrorhamnose 3,5-epimerase
MKIIKTEIPDVLLIEPKLYEDNRGYFMETYQKNIFIASGIFYDFVQDNQSRSQKGTLRGLHYQINHAQGKLIRAIIGEIFDVAVDIRRSSPTFGRWVGEIISADNKKQIWIPPGFAHGFLAMSDWAEVLYKATDFYSPENERSIRWDDPDIGIFWPTTKDVVIHISEKDRLGHFFNTAEVYP